MASTGLRRTLSGNGNQYTATFSVWVKRTSTANDARIYTSWYDGNNQGWITFTNNTVGFFIYQSSSYSVQVRTNRVFRDVSAFYHLVVRIDTTQASASNRVRVYVNGTQETSFSTRNNPGQNDDGIVLENYDNLNLQINLLQFQHSNLQYYHAAELFQNLQLCFCL